MTPSSLDLEQLAKAVTPQETDAIVRRLAALEGEVQQLRTELAASQKPQLEDRATFCLISADFEKVMTILMLAHAAAALELRTSVFFAFWGVQAIKKESQYRGKPPLEMALTSMMKSNIHQLASSRFNFGGMGPAFFQKLMKDKGILTPAQMLAATEDSGIQLQACSMSMDVLGISEQELLPGVSLAGATTFMELCGRSRISMIL